mmetsp:Transcript_30208/g.46083  ORF Transcript_30208/g.46083 Transcript_30208/m.46083 type:complete len:330 (-) Transcript_30208:101-1090(-)
MQNSLFILGFLALFCLCTTYALQVSGKVAVIGSTGRLGREAVQQLSQAGIPCKILVRRPISVAAPQELTEESTKEELSAYLASLPEVEVVQGDVTNADSLKVLFEDCTACLALFGATRRSALSDIWNKNVEDFDPSHAKQVNYQGVANIIKAAKASKSCKRIVRITGDGENPTSFFSILINMLGSMAKAWNYEGEQLLRADLDIEYTIIRPGIMSEEGPEGRVLKLADDGNYLPVAKIRYASVASLCIESLQYPNAARATLAASTSTEGGEATWETLLKTVKSDRRDFPSDMFQQHKAAVKKTVAMLGVFTTLTLATLLQFVVKNMFFP